ncbi:hypothetical protein AB0G04_04580 [Actinoplanes sp. NPDC023801]|uniref:hypothetical protein n=1 Tax=Actinoplanes sp. NPDC023801 TaxID=3154595 RepID=UPI0033CB8E59
MHSGVHDTEVLPRAYGGRSDLNEALAAAAPRRWWNRTTVGLIGLALLAGGFLGGVQAHERWGIEETQAGGAPDGAGMPTGSGGSLGPAAPGGRPAVSGSGPAQDGSAQGGPVQGGGAQPAMGGTAGTVKMVDGTTLYVQTDAGETVTVRTGEQTTVKVSQTASLESITSGLPVTVEGVPDAEGVITATAITAG